MSPITLVTLNIAHGRGLSLYQGFQSPERIRDNMARIARFINRHRIDIIALQEVDEDSHWNGRIDLLEYLRELTGLRYSCMGVNNSRSGMLPLAYGNAILSRYPIACQENLPFGEATLGEKGFLYAEVEIEDHLLPVVNLHLDFRSRQVRLSQVAKLLNFLTERGNFRKDSRLTEPIICGDFNSRSGRERDAVRHLLKEVEMHAEYELLPNRGMTFPSYLPSRGLDFIFLPRCYHKIHCEIIRAFVSDHRPVLVEFTL